MELAGEQKLQIHGETHAGITYLRFEGVIDEQFDPAGATTSLESALIISLAGVRRITSFGIRQWTEFVEQAGRKCAHIYYLECPPRIIDQFNMVANFGGKGVVVSFLAPFRCPSCGQESLKLVQVDRDRAQVRDQQLQGGVCPADQSALQLDDDPQSFLSYLATQPELSLEPRIAAFFSERTEYQPQETARRWRIDKHVRDRCTFISISGELGRDLPVEKIAEGLEGQVLLDLREVERVTPDGRGQWRSLLARISPGTERLFIAGLPPAMLQGLARADDLGGKGQVLSLRAEVVCGACSRTAVSEIEAGDGGYRPRCAECGASAHFAADEIVQQALAQLPPLDTQLRVGRLLQLARAPREPARTEEARRLPVGVIALLLLLLLGLGMVVLLRPWVRRGIGAQPGARLLASSHPRPPSWRDRAYTVSGDQILVVGRSPSAADLEEARQIARHHALDLLGEAIAERIKSASWGEHVARQYRAVREAALREAAADDAPTAHRGLRKVLRARERVAQAFRQGGAPLRLEAGESYWEKTQLGSNLQLRAWTLFQVPAQDLDRAISHYSRQDEVLGATVVPYFPGLAWRQDLAQGAVVVAIRPESPLRRIGLAAGDVIVSVQERGVKDSPALVRLVDQHLAMLQREGGVLGVHIRRGDSPETELRLQVPRSRRPQGGGASRPTPTGNIWDDDPYE